MSAQPKTLRIARIPCDGCDGFGWIDVPGQVVKQRCLMCKGVGSIRQAVECPVHGQLVAVDVDGRLLGRCAGCAQEAAIGMRRIEDDV